MRKILIGVFAAVFAIAALAGCANTPTPTAVAKETLDAIKSQDLEKIQAHYAGNVDDVNVAGVAGNASGLDLSSYTEEQKAMVDELIKTMTSFDYELGEESIDGDKATVAAKITTYDLGAVFSEAMGDYFTAAMAAAFSGGETDESAMTALFLEKFNEKLANHTEKTHVADVSLGLTKVDGEWKIDDLSDEVKDAVMGGLISGAENFANSLGSIADSAA